jgi:hypothetical protein
MSALGTLVHTDLVKIEANATHLLRTWETDLQTGVTKLLSAVHVNADAALASLASKAEAFGYKLVQMSSDELAALKQRVTAAQAAAQTASPAAT